jgi:predicted dehydrogenase
MRDRFARFGHRFGGSGHRSRNGHRNGNGNARIGIGIVGVGYWGSKLVRNIHEVPSASLVQACDQRAATLEVIARRYPSVDTTTSFDEILEDERVDAVVVATPVSTHHPLAAEALRAGKHVFVEKPMAASSDEAVDLIETAEKSARVLMPGHTFLYSPAVTMIRDLIEAEELGEIYFISTSRVNLGIHQPDVSVAWDLGPHDFSILRYWLGETPIHVSAFSRACIMPGVPDVAFIDLEFPSGTVAHVELSWLAPSKLRRTTIVGSQKMVVYDDTSPEPIRIFDSGAVLPNPTSFGEHALTYRTGDIVSPRIEVAEPLHLELEDFCSAILLGKVPRSSAALGLEVVRIVEAVDSSLKQGAARVELGAGIARAV